MCVWSVTIKERKALESSRAPEKVFCVAVSMPVWKVIIFGGDSTALRGLPRCKIYRRLDWVFFLRAFTRHLKHCQERYFLNASEVATAKLHLPILEIYFWNGMQGFIRPRASRWYWQELPRSSLARISPSAQSPPPCLPGTHTRAPVVGIGPEARPLFGGHSCQLINLRVNCCLT